MADWGNGTSAEIKSFIATATHYRYLACYNDGTTDHYLGPLAGPPQIESEVETKEIFFYETGDEAQSEIITKNQIIVTIESRDLETATSLISDLKKGDDLLAQEENAPAKTLVLTPISKEGDTNAKSITFHNVFIKPGLSMTLSDGDENPSSVKLVFVCKEDTEAEDFGRKFIRRIFQYRKDGSEYALRECSLSPHPDADGSDRRRKYAAAAPPGSALCPRRPERTSGR